jgi:hypothetical protein
MNTLILIRHYKALMKRKVAATVSKASLTNPIQLRATGSRIKVSSLKRIKEMKIH